MSMVDDPRVDLAAQRTLLAWIRTGLAMMGFGFLVARFGLFMQEIEILRGRNAAESPQWSVWIGAAMVVLGVVVNLVVGLEHLWHRLEWQHRRHRFAAGYSVGIASAFVLAAVGAFMVLRLFAL